MIRRKFVQHILATSALSTAVEAGQAPPPAKTPEQQPKPQPNTPARQDPRQPPGVPKLRTIEPDLAAETPPHLFTAVQFATLRKLGATLMPPLKSNPGALDAKAPEFLDFLISASPAERQKSYQFGLDQLELQAKNKFQASFSELNGTQIDAILRPLLLARPWPADLPSDPLQAFVAQVHDDLRTATMNSREWAAASENSVRRFSRGFRTSGYYVRPIDPISQG